MRDVANPSPYGLYSEKPGSKLPMWHPEQSRRIVKRIVITGDLVLVTPASFSNGDQGDLVDITLLVDACDGKSPLFPGASLAGALRSYLSAIDESKSILLFGGKHSDSEGEQSHVIVDDARSKNGQLEVRDGVRIDPASRTAKDKMLYNREVWSAGTRFPLRLELLVCEPRGKYNPPQEIEMRQALATALAGINSGAITFGGRKTRGFGKAEVKEWVVKTYDFTELSDLQAWINGEMSSAVAPKSVATYSKIEEALGVDIMLPDTRSYFEMKVTLALKGSLLIRAEGVSKYDPDAAHLRNRRNDPILSGTSLAGALRARASKIAKTLKLGGEIVTEQMFGTDMEAMKKRNEAIKKRNLDGGLPAIRQERPRGSRVTVTEQIIQRPAERMVQNRVSIDRFTGGALETALFNVEPVFGRPGSQREPGTHVALTIGLKRPELHEIGLLLHLLKDLWTQDLSLGGEASVGRGRFQGIEAELWHHISKRHWHLMENEGAIQVTGDAREELEAFASAFNAWNPLTKHNAQVGRIEGEVHGK